MNEHRVVDMDAWKAAHLRPISWYGLFYAYYSANWRIVRAWMEYWR